ncbi:MAG: GAF domain-containing protein [Candidatus Rokubacteria bacterium]|nr:GAF domain-containing protein [Candidatus Rokubacteria bacterium]
MATPARRGGRSLRRVPVVRPTGDARRARSDRALVAERALITLAEAATAGLPPPEMLELVVAAAAALTGDATVHLWLVDDERRELRLVAQAGPRPGKAGVRLRPVLRVGEGLAGAVARRREPLVLTSLRAERHVADPAWARDQGFVSFAGVPFARADRLLGVLCVFTRRRHRFTRYEVDLLRSFASHAAVALESAALLEAATSRLRRLEALQEIEREMSQQRDPDALLGLIVRRAAELLEADSATVFLLDEAAGLLRAHASFNEPDWVREFVLPLGEGVVGTVAVRREGMIVNDYPHSPYAIARLRQMDWAVVAQPLLRGETVQGVILVRRRTAGRAFAETDLDELGDFAVQASIALENVRLLRLTSARAERVKAAAEVGQLLASTLDADRILDVIAEKCREILGAQAFGLFLFDANERLRYARGFGLDPAFMREHTLALGEGVVGKAALERCSIQTVDLLRDPAIALSPAARARVEREGSRALVAVPILARAEVLGVLAVYHPPGFRIPAEEAEFLETLANHAAAALENARLFAQTRRRQESAETLAALTQILTGSLDLSTVLSLVADGVRRLLGSDGGAIGLAEADGAIRLRVGVGLGAEAFRDIVVRPGRGVGGRVLERGEPFWTADYLNDRRITPDFVERARAAGLVAELAVPVRMREEVIGVLWAFYGRPVRITDEDLAFASDLAQVVAIAVENARLYEEARRREAEARTLFEVGRLLVATLDPEQVLDLIVEKARGLMGVPACGLFRLDEQGILRFARGAGLSPEFVHSLSIRLGEGTSGAAVVRGVPVWTADILADETIPLGPATRALVEKEGYRGVLSVPVWIKEAPFGSLAAYWFEPHAATPAEVETLSSLATLAAVALDNVRLFGEAQDYVARLEGLYGVNRAVSASLRLDDVLGTVAQAAGSLLGAPLVTLWVADEERRFLARRAGYGDPELLARIPTRLAYGETGAGWVAEHRKPLLDVPVEGNLRILEGERAAARGITTFSGVPVLLGDRLLGVLVIGGRREAPLSAADVTLLRTLMGQAAVAIENARLYGEAQRQEAEAVALAEASRRFSATLRREAVLRALVEAAGHVLGEMWGVFVVEPETGELRAIAPTAGDGSGREPLRPTAAAPPMRAPEPLLARVVTTGTPLLLRDVDELAADDPWRPDLSRLGMRSALIVPVVAGGVVRAVLAGGIQDDSRPFTERDLRLAQAVADRAGTALENARLFEELTRAYQDLKAAQEHLVQTEKLRALGEMASGVAHDFNNILAAILGRVQLLMNQIEDPTLRRWLEIVERAALDGAQTVQQIQEFTRIRRDQPAETVDLNQMVRDAVEMTQTRWREQTQSQGLDVRVALNLEPVPAVEGHPAELRQVLTNLILNAVDALPRGGTITITSRAAGEGIEVSVADTGVGMPEEVRRRIFEPFFSTKGPKGTGLGLAMVYGIVSRHGGTVTVASREGAGSTFTIRLPVGFGRREVVTAPLVLAPDRAARVLVIDDEEPVRDALADMLRLTRHEVVVASQGVEGLEYFRTAPFDLVMTDLAMPGMSGWQVAQAVKALRPNVPVVLVTGWGVELSAEQLRAHGVDHVMTKPFRIDDVHAVLAGFLRRIRPHA